MPSSQPQDGRLRGREDRAPVPDQPEPMKIAVIVSMKYGLTTFIMRDIEALQQRGHDVALFSLLNNPGLYVPRPDWKVVVANRYAIIAAAFRFGLRRPLTFLSLVRDALRTKSLVNLLVALHFAPQMSDRDVIYAYFGDHKLFTGYYCKRITGIPLIVTIRAYELYRNPNPRMLKESLPLCDKIVTVSEHNKNQLTERYDVPADKVDVVRQVVDLETFKATNRLKILIVGYFAQKKGHEILFQAFKQLERDDVELWVAGDLNPSVTPVDCRKLAEDLEIDSKVAFFGVQRGTALRALYRECDIFCLPSRKDRYGDQEGFPNVIAEAMAFSKPIVSTFHAGIPEAIDTLLVEENNVDDLAAALREACDNAELRRRLGVTNRARAEQLFSPANSDRLASILAEHALRQPSHSLPRACRTNRVDAPDRDTAASGNAAAESALPTALQDDGSVAHH